jgi:hypothetical protein
LFVVVFSSATFVSNGLWFCEVGDLEARSLNLAQLYDKAQMLKLALQPKFRKTVVRLSFLYFDSLILIN